MGIIIIQTIIIDNVTVQPKFLSEEERRRRCRRKRIGKNNWRKTLDKKLFIE
jgi:hypothetical protein